MPDQKEEELSVKDSFWVGVLVASIAWAVLLGITHCDSSVEERVKHVMTRDKMARECQGTLTTRYWSSGSLRGFRCVEEEEERCDTQATNQGH